MRLRRKVREAVHSRLGTRQAVIEPSEACASLSRLIPRKLDELWATGQSGPTGPIDVIDMFSGCGGMSAGFLAANAVVPAFRPILAVDLDTVANRSYEANLHLTPQCIDIATLAGDRRLLDRTIAASQRDPRHPLVLIGCAPCQGFSSHRNSAGARDSRNSLFVHFAQIAVRLLPDAIVVENVPELLTTRYWSYLRKARTLLEEAGYYVHLGVHNMATFGVGQERFRAVMLAMRKPFHPLTGHMDRPAFRTVRDVIGKLPSIRAGQRLASDPMHYTANHSESTLETIRAVPKDGGSRPAGVGPACLVRAKIKNGRGAYDDVYGRLHWDRPAITMTAYARNPASGRFVHPEQNRGLSVREAALLQGFPTNYWFSGSLDERFRQIGNAVPPLFSTQLALHILGQLLTREAEGHSPGLTEPCGVSFSRLIPALKLGHSLESMAPA
jgi:DNA (cytosine-5)-methyltransferase 1